MRYLFLLLIFLSSFSAATTLEEFIKNIKTIAIENGVKKITVDRLLTNIKPNTRILELDNSQAEFNRNFWHYLNVRVNSYRILIGKNKIKEHVELFDKIYQKYGLPKHILIAFLALESNYGTNTGSFNLLQALFTLAYDQRRRDFFTEQLLVALKLIDSGRLKENANSSWAGAVGAMQFMPTNIDAYGVDANKDGSVDLWQSQQDIFYSAANFLQHIGWVKGEIWGREVVLPANFDYKISGINTKKTLKEWRKLGIQTTKLSPLANINLKASLLLPMGYKGPSFLVYNNFKVIMRWNNSILYALSIGILADALIDNNIKAQFINEKNLSKNNIKFIQKQLIILGFDAGEIDGIIGPKTKTAVKKYQIKNNLIADGYIGYVLFKQLQQKYEEKKLLE